MRGANEWIGPRIGLHWTTRAVIDWAAGRPFTWIDDEITGIDRLWVEESHPGQALLHRTDPRCGLSEDDFTALEKWFRKLGL